MSGVRVVILGSGMSALAAAEKLAELGAQVEVYERDEVPGGLAKSFSWGGFKYNDLGPHIWHTPNQNLANEWKARFGELLHQGKFFGQTLVGDPPGKYFDYPLSREALSQFEPALRVKIQAELQMCSRKEQIRATSFDEYVSALVGPTLKNIFFKEYPEKLWGVPTSKMTANWAPKRIRFTEEQEEFHGNQWAAVGKRGSGALIESIYKSALDKGVVFKFGFDVISIKTQNCKILEISARDGRKIDINPSDKVISTIPFNFIAKELGFNNSLSYRGAVLIYFSIKRESVIPGRASFLYFSQKDVPFHRLSEQKKFCSIGWPEGRTTLTAEVAFNETDADNLNVESIVEESIDSLERFQLVERGTIESSTYKILPNVYPILTKANEVEFKSTYAGIKEFSQLFLVGTSGEFHYADLQILYQKGRDIAERIMEESPMLNPKTLENGNLNNNSFFSYFSNKRPFIIAEIGLNHGGSVDIAKELILAAKDAGVKYVKFQTYNSESRVSQTYRANNYSEEILDTEESLFSMFKKHEFTQDQWKELFEFASLNDLKMFSAVFDLESLEMLESLSCPAYKIASMDLNNYPLIDSIAMTKKPIILSTGMATLGEIEKSVKIIRSRQPSEFIILHCVSSYPADMKALNLRAMGTLEKAFGQPVGFSDHSIGTEIPIIAASVGAICIEKHFTLDRDIEGPDHLFSVDPQQMKYLVKILDQIPEILGNSFDLRSPQELETAYKFKKSMHAARRILVGEKLTAADISIKGPYGGIAPEYYHVILDRNVRKTIELDSPITWDHL